MRRRHGWFGQWAICIGIELINRKDFGQTDDNSRTWNVDLPAGQSVSLRITDSTGAINYSEKVTIREGSSTSCLNG